MDEEVLKDKEKQLVCQHMGLWWNSTYVKHCLKLVLFKKYYYLIIYRRKTAVRIYQMLQQLELKFSLFSR
jgi:hypothetical protein